MGPYPVLRFWGRHGRLIAILAGLAVGLGGIALAVLIHPLWLLPGLAAAGFTCFLLLSYAELIRVLMDMLLPDPDLE